MAILLNDIIRVYYIEVFVVENLIIENLIIVTRWYLNTYTFFHVTVKLRYIIALYNDTRAQAVDYMSNFIQSIVFTFILPHFINKQPQRDNAYNHT